MRDLFATRAFVLVGALVFAAGAVAHAGEGGAWIGVQLAPGRHGGVLVKGVLPGAPGERAGIAAGDEVLRFEGRPVGRPDDLIAEVGRAEVGRRVSLVVRGAAASSPMVRTVWLVLERRPEPDDLQRQTLVGKPAPDAPLKVVAGEHAESLAAFKGQVVLLDFFATWCQPCREAMPGIERLHQRFGRRGLKVLGVSTESAAIVAQAAERFHLHYSLVADENRDLSDRYHVFALPTAVVIDRRGVVHLVSVADADQAERAVLALVGSK